MIASKHIYNHSDAKICAASPWMNKHEKLCLLISTYTFISLVRIQIILLTFFFLFFLLFFFFFLQWNGLVLFQQVYVTATPQPTTNEWITITCDSNSILTKAFHTEINPLPCICCLGWSIVWLISSCFVFLNEDTFSVQHFVYVQIPCFDYMHEE